MWPFKTNLKLNGIQRDIPAYTGENYTPDRLWLERHEWVYMFFYDETMLNRKNYKFIREDSFRLWQAFTANDKFVMWKKRLGTETFPIPLEGADKIYDGPGVTSVRLNKLGPERIKATVMGRIKGEIHAVRPHVLWNTLDRHYLNGLEFRRERVKLIVPYRIKESNDEFLKTIKAHMYVGIKDYWSPQLDGGLLYSTVGAFAPNKRIVDGTRIGIYYHYSRLEYGTNA